MAKTGRQHKLAEPETLRRLTENLELGLSVAVACTHAGISTSSYHSWKSEALKAERRRAKNQKLSVSDSMYLEFLDAIKKAEATFLRNTHLIIGAASRRNWQAAAWLAERTRPEMYSLSESLRAQSELGDIADMWVEAARLAAIMEGTMRGIPAPPNTLSSEWTTFNWTARQMAMLSSTARFLLLPCGRGSGKTEIAFRRLIIALAVKKEWDRPLYFYAAPTNPQAMRIGWEKLKAMIPKEWIAHVSITKQYIETIFGSRIYVAGLDQPHRIEGPQWDGGVYDESSDQKPGAFTLSLRPALAHKRGWCYRIGVPKRRGIGAAEYREACDKARLGQEPDSEEHAWSAEDVLPEDEIAALKVMLAPEDYAEQVQAKWLSSSGGMFMAFDEGFNVRKCSYDPALPLIIGCDFNVNPMVWVFGHDRGGVIEIFQEMFIRNTITEEQVERAYQMFQDHHGGVLFYCDASCGQRDTAAVFTDYAHIANHHGFKSLQSIIDFPRYNENGKLQGNPPVKSRVSATNARLLNAAGQRRMFVDPTCKQLIHDLKTRYWQHPESGDMGHATDALGYIVWARYPIKILLENDDPVVILKSGKPARA